MRFSTVLAASLAAWGGSAAPSPAVEKRHYTFPSLSGTSNWADVRQTVNYQSNAGLSDVTSDQIRCYQAVVKGSPSSSTVAAGGSVTFTASPNIFHPGPIQFYMARVPSTASLSTWDGSGDVWFKIYAEPVIKNGNQLSWASLNKGTITANIPKSLPTGDYLLRIEHIALHQASALNGAQFYISCAQVHVTGGGSGSPSPLVSLPGAYSASDPGIHVNIYSTTAAYTPPGPAVWQG